MTDDDDLKPALELGIVILPLVTCNFTTSEGDNPVATNCMRLANDVLNEAMEKVVQAIKMYCDMNDVEFRAMDAEKLQRMGTDLLNAQEGDPVGGYQYAGTVKH